MRHRVSREATCGNLTVLPLRRRMLAEARFAYTDMCYYRYRTWFYYVVRGVKKGASSAFALWRVGFTCEACGAVLTSFVLWRQIYISP